MMTQARDELGEWPWGVPVPPSGDELPCDDGEPMETELHAKQLSLTRDYAHVLLQGRGAYVAGNLAFYYSAVQARKLDFKAPDVMIFLDVEQRVRRSWVVWEEDGRVPAVVIELLSESTRANDLGRKKNVYERIGVRDYFVYDPLTAELRGWHLHDGRYQALAADERGRLASAALGVRLGVAEGTYEEVTGPWLRFFDAAGELVPTAAEAEARRADEQARRADEQARRADEAERELAALRARLAALEGGERR
ncbi:MAG: Uma2 family endonuclease [Deltaproteobacteria bacterium]|nr:Uma2 family endonuclease [Deltaproteobacteria bacterium]